VEIPFSCAAIRENRMTEQELIRRFHQALAEIAQLAGAIGEQHWQQAFFDRHGTRWPTKPCLRGNACGWPANRAMCLAVWALGTTMQRAWHNIKNVAKSTKSLVTSFLRRCVRPYFLL